MNKILLIVLVITAIIFVNVEEIETFVLRRRRRHMRHALHHRDIYPTHHHYRPMRRYWYSFATDWYHYLPCKSGCTNLGNGKWGCQYPSIDGCVFARDCQGC